MEPVAGATITLKRSTNNQPSSVISQLSSDSKGEFTMTDLLLTDTLIISAIGYETTMEIFDFNFRGHITVILKRRTSVLDEAVVIAYGKTTKRLNISSISTITADEISRQPVSNPLSALIGRVPGLIVTPTSGVPGAALKLELRGRTSIAQSFDPLIIIDGVPFAPGNDRLNSLSSAATTPGDVTAGGLSPLNSINPADIESIEVLKDADATAIYGSRGANGVILITTKKGKSGQTRYNLGFSSGWGLARAVPDVLSTNAYLQMRREAFANDGESPSMTTAPDLLVYDTGSYTNFRKLLTGGTARTTNLQASVSGGNASTQFSLGTGYYKETTVYPGQLANHRLSFRTSLSHNTPGGRFTLNLTTYYAAENNNLAAGDLTQYIGFLPPNMPGLLDDSGRPVWQYKGISFTENPLAYLSYTNTAATDNLASSINLGFQIAKGLVTRVNAGYNTLQVKEESIRPLLAQNPMNNPQAASDFAATLVKSWMVEPQLEYKLSIGLSKLTFLTGGSWQQNTTASQLINAFGFPNDALLKYTGAAASVQVSNSAVVYRYAAAFGRLQYNYKQKYLLNLSGRRDGSSRFGPGRQYADFEAVGLGWIFSAEPFMARHWPFLSFGKLRGSYGSSGNDKIGDYQYLDTWQTATYAYQGVTTLRPSRLYNPDYSWEQVRKLEAGLDLGFLNDKLLFSLAWYRNRSGNQLIRYNLPQQTGFSSIVKNFPALVQNTGWELTLTKKEKREKNFGWETSLNISIPANRLVAFPGIDFLLTQAWS